jgi:hypothetical protein
VDTLSKKAFLDLTSGFVQAWRSTSCDAGSGECLEEDPCLLKIPRGMMAKEESRQ